MLPQSVNDGLEVDFEEAEIEPSNTFNLNLDKNRCYGSVDGIEALKQAIFLMFAIERYEHVIYSWNIGIETKDLIGMPYDYVCSELKRRIPDGLLQDDRINDVADFVFERNKKKLHVTFTVYSIFGEFGVEREVDY